MDDRACEGIEEREEREEREIGELIGLILTACWLLAHDPGYSREDWRGALLRDTRIRLLRRVAELGRRTKR